MKEEVAELRTKFKVSELNSLKLQNEVDALQNEIEINKAVE